MKARQDLRMTFGAAVVGGALLAGGCAMPDSSNPTLSITSAQVGNNSATLGMRIDNPSDMDVTVDAVDWSLVYGPLPVADGSWTMGVPVPSKGTHDFTREVSFTSPALDRSADTLELSGTMELQTQGGSGNMGLNEAGFVTTVNPQR